MAMHHDNFRAGLFVLFGMVLAIIVIYLLADLESITRETQTVGVFYSLDDGVQGLKPGAIVTLGDQPIGEVEDIQSVEHKDGSGRVVGMKVVVVIPADVKLHWDAEIQIVKPAIGSGTSLNIRSVGGRDGIPRYSRDETMPPAVVPDWAIAHMMKDRSELSTKEILDSYQGPTDCIPGAIAGSSLVKNLASRMGIQAEQRRQIQSIIANVDGITSNLRNELPEVMENAKHTMIKARSIAEKAESSVDDIRDAIKDVKDTTTLVKEKVQVWSDKIEGSLDDVKATTARARALVDQNSPTVTSTLENLKTASDDIKQVASDVKNKTFVQVTDALDKAKLSMENLRVTAANARNLVVAQKPILERTIANAHIMSDQLKLTAIEVRRSPWRLLHAPTEEEMETDQLYDAARSFALAAGALDGAVAQLKAVNAEDSQVNAGEVARILEHLNNMFSKFEEAENRFWQKLRDRNAASLPSEPVPAEPQASNAN